MDFKAVLEKLLGAFEREDIAYALIGGFAVSLWGVPRATVDIDFLIRGDDMAKAGKILESIGYTCHYASDNVSQFESPDAHLGQVDFLHAIRPIALAMLDRAQRKSIFDGEATIPVIQPEDLIGLKVQAIANNASRKAIDMADIEALMKLWGIRLNWQRVEDYFALFDMQEEFTNLRRRYDVCARQ